MQKRLKCEDSEFSAKLLILCLRKAHTFSIAYMSKACIAMLHKGSFHSFTLGGNLGKKAVTKHIPSDSNIEAKQFQFGSRFF